MIEAHQCQVCKMLTTRIEKHHIYPRELGGTDDPENILLLCRECHNKVDRYSFEEQASITFLQYHKIQNDPELFLVFLRMASTVFRANAYLKKHRAVS